MLGVQMKRKKEFGRVKKMEIFLIIFHFGPFVFCKNYIEVSPYLFVEYQIVEVTVIHIPLIFFSFLYLLFY